MSDTRIWPVQNSPLLRAPQRLAPRCQLHDLIHRLIANLVSITDETGEFLQHLDDGRVLETKGWSGWEWTHGIGLYGMWQYYDQTGDKGVFASIDAWFATHLPEGTTKNVNTMSPILTLACQYEQTRNHTIVPHLEAWGSWAMQRMTRTARGGMQHVTLVEENPGQLWDDTLMMTALPLAKIGRILDRPEYVDEAAFQFLTHTAYLQDRSTGLWFHGWTFPDSHNFAEARWARGNSWITMAIPDFIDIAGLAPSDPIQRFLTEVLCAQVEALGETQDESGLWHTLLDDPESYLEASASAGIAYGILKGIRLGLVPSTFASVAERAVGAVIGLISPDGELQQVSFGTAMGTDLDFYRHIPLTAMPYGQAMAILALTEYLRTYY